MIKKSRNKWAVFLDATAKYIASYHQWIIAILVTILVVPWGVYLTRQSETHKENMQLRKTATYYFMPTTHVETSKIKDDAKCWDSNASSRSDAYRCIVKDVIYDPCFLSRIGYMDCPSKPDDHQILMVESIEPKNTRKKDPASAVIPWYVVLENNISCRYYTGSSDNIVGGRVDYGCSDKSVLSLPIDSNDNVHTIKCYDQKNERVAICNIRVAWY